MASGDHCLTYSKSSIPLVGALIDYVDTSLEYFWLNTFAHAERLHRKVSRATLSASFMASVCFMLGLVANIKFEVMTLDDEPLTDDLHFLLLSKEDTLYIDEVDVNNVMWCLEMSDLVVITLSCLLVWNSSNFRSPLSEYMFLPWLGATLRGLLFNQAPTAGALLYTMAVINGMINPLFITAFSFLFLLEARLWLEVARLVHLRWERRDYRQVAENGMELETLWSNDDVQSVEVRNYVY